MGEFVVTIVDPAQSFDTPKVAFDTITRALGRTL